MYKYNIKKWCMPSVSIEVLKFNQVCLIGIRLHLGQYLNGPFISQLNSNRRESNKQTDYNIWFVHINLTFNLSILLILLTKSYNFSHKHEHFTLSPYNLIVIQNSTQIKNQKTKWMLPKFYLFFLSMLNSVCLCHVSSFK